MLILTRKKHEPIYLIEDNKTIATVLITAIGEDSVKVGIEAPDNIIIRRHNVKKWNNSNE